MMLSRLFITGLILVCSIYFGTGVDADEADRFFDDTFVHEIRMTLADSDWYDTLYGAYISGDDDFYLPCKWDYSDDEGSISIDPIGIRFKGNSSFFDSGEKKSFKIDFNQYLDVATFMGLKKLNLNNNFLDPTLLREKLFLDFLAGRSAVHRAVFVRVIINDELWGVFTATEQIDSTYIARILGDNEEGNLYKGESQADLTYLGSDPALYDGRYEKKTHETENDWTDLVNFIYDLNQIAPEEAAQIFPELIDYDLFVEQFAANILFANLDTYFGPAHNYYLYHREDTDRFVHLTWDCNMAFGTYDIPFPDSFDMTQVPLLWRDTEGSGRPLVDIPWNNHVLVRDHYRTLAHMLRTGFDPESLGDRIDAMANIIRADVYADPKKDFSNEQFEQNLESEVSGIIGLKQFVIGRSIYVKATLDELALRTDLRLNELMAQNTTTWADESGDFDPWIEIYNLGPGRVSTTQMYLTNDSNTPDQWELPVAAIEDGHYSIYWIDGEEHEGANHASFRLNADGGVLYCYQLNGSDFELVDSVVYPALGPDSVWGRWPDGTGEWQILGSATAGTANVPPSPPDLHLFINEIMASNTNGHPDEHGEFEDWIEIYNSGTDSVNLKGMFLTDITTSPTKWTLPDITILPGDYAVLICDEEQEEGSTHTNFKLAQEGETISLYYSDGVNLIDAVTYPAQNEDVSYGRCPDGSSQWQFLSTDTPGDSNDPFCSTPKGMTLILEDTDLVYGDTFDLHFTLGPQSVQAQLDAYVLLGIANSYWCWPGWKPLEEKLDYQTYQLQSWETLDEEVLKFSWPKITGSAGGLFFYGAAFFTQSFEITGDYQMIEFGYH